MSEPIDIDKLDAHVKSKRNAPAAAVMRAYPSLSRELRQLRRKVEIATRKINTDAHDHCRDNKKPVCDLGNDRCSDALEALSAMSAVSKEADNG